MHSLEDLDESYWEHVEELIDFGFAIKVPELFWNMFFDLQEIWGVGLLAFYRQDEDESLLVVSVATNPSTQNFEVHSGAHFVAKWLDPTSCEWFVCKAADHLRECFSGDEEHRVKAAFQFGLAVSEAQWIAFTADRLKSARGASVARTRAGFRGGQASRTKRKRNIELFMQELEKLANVADLISEERVIAQALEVLREREPSFPKSKKTLDDYGTAIRSEEPFKSRYEAVFRKNA